MTEFLLSILFLVIFWSVWTGRVRRGVFRMTKRGQTLQDLSAGAWTVSVLHDYAWLSRFGKDWRAQYYTTWAMGLGKDVWFYTPRSQ